MPLWLELFLIVGLFLIGLRLSAFFSGAETGYYRLSIPRVNIDAQAGDKTAKRILWFVHNPSYFVATTLIGNNVANYITTLAIGWASIAAFTSAADQVEIIATVLMSPVVFLFGELLPKNLYYRAPLSRMRRDIQLFRGFFALFIPLSWPLVALSKVFERMSGSSAKPLDVLIGRNRLLQVVHHGRREGVLTEVQSQLANGILQTASQPVANSMTPVQRVLGISETATREEMLTFARRYGLASIPIHREGQPNEYVAYVRVVDLVLDTRSPVQLFQPLPHVPLRSGKLEALLSLHEAGAAFGALVDNGRIAGLVSERGLVEQLFRPPTSPAVPS